MNHSVRSRRFPSILLFLLASMLSLSISAQKKETAPREPIPVESMLAGPDHADMPWKVTFSEPRLMYQQQHFLLIRAKMPAEIMDRDGKHVMHFLAKVQDRDGHWAPGDEYNKFEPAAKLGDTKDIECGLVVYLRPGEYTVAMIAYDSTTRKSNVLRRRILVRPISGDPLPEFTEHIPAVEFPDDFPDNDLDRVAKSDGESFTVGHQLSPLAVTNTGNVRIDVVLNVSKQEFLRPEEKRIPGFDRETRIDRYERMRRAREDALRASHAGDHAYVVGRVLQSASVLSRIAPTNGCIYVTALDPIRMQVPLPTKKAGSIEWPALGESLLKLDQNVIDVRVLQNHNGPGTFLHDTFEKLSAKSEECGSGPVTDHYVLVVSPTLTLPGFDGEMRLSDASAERAKFFYFHVPSENPFSDDMGKILKSAKARQFTFNNPEGFRKALASFLSDLRAGK